MGAKYALFSVWIVQISFKLWLLFWFFRTFLIRIAVLILVATMTSLWIRIATISKYHYHPWTLLCTGPCLNHKPAKALTHQHYQISSSLWCWFWNMWSLILMLLNLTPQANFFYYRGTLCVIHRWDAWDFHCKLFSLVFTKGHYSLIEGEPL